jgi:hypothetical protein
MIGNYCLLLIYHFNTKVHVFELLDLCVPIGRTLIRPIWYLCCFSPLNWNSGSLILGPKKECKLAAPGVRSWQVYTSKGKRPFTI